MARVEALRHPRAAAPRNAHIKRGRAGSGWGQRCVAFPAAQVEVRGSEAAEAHKEKATERFDWQRQWYAVGIIDDFPTDRPMPIVILGKDLVVWRDGGGAWRVFDDKCPHRKVPLSEGRLETDGTLQCSYHGWRFDGGGACKLIPNTLPSQDGPAMLANPRACATAFPTYEHDGLLFVWMHAGPNALQESAQSPPHVYTPPSNPDEVRTPWTTRTMHQSWVALMENITDPSHVPFSHHGVQGDRNKPMLMAFDTIAKMELGRYLVESPFTKVSAGGQTRMSAHSVDLSLPGYYKLDTWRPGATGGADGRTPSFCINSHVVPVTPGCTRFIVRFEMTVLNGTKAGKMLQRRPVWHDHLERMAVLDGDGVFLTRQSQLLRSGAVKPRQYYVPTAADLPCLALHQWIAKFSPGGPQFYPDVADDPAVINSLLSRESVLDRYQQHVKDCKACSGALRNVRVGMRAVYACAALAFLALVAFLGRGQPLLSAGPLVAAAAMAAAAAGLAFLERFETKFTFQDYVHAER